MVKVQVNALSMFRLRSMLRFRLRSRCVLEVKFQAKLQANFVKVHCEVW